MSLTSLFARDTRGTSGLEYGLIASIVVTAIACVVTWLGVDIDRVMNTLSKAIGN